VPKRMRSAPPVDSNSGLLQPVANHRPEARGVPERSLWSTGPEKYFACFGVWPSKAKVLKNGIANLD
jgi:hypothetical protein